MAEQSEGSVTVYVPERGKIFRRVAMRVNSGQSLPTVVGEIDGVRVYVRERDGRVHVIMTDEDLYE